jgi:hypothetical protein
MVMSWDDSVAMIALVSVPLLIVASFLVDLAAGNRYTQRMERRTSERRSPLELFSDPWLSAWPEDGPVRVRSRGCPYAAVRSDPPRTGSVQVSSRGKLCRQHRG